MRRSTRPIEGTLSFGPAAKEAKSFFACATRVSAFRPKCFAKIFDMFVQVDQSLDRSQGGLGIGLTLVRSLAELHGGTVGGTATEPGQGSEFIVRLPALADAITATINLFRR